MSPYTAYVVASDGLYLRSHPSMKGNAIKVLPFATELKVIGDHGEWLHVDASGDTGYMWSGFISTQKPRQVEDKPSDLQAIIEKLATEYNLPARLAKAVFAVEAGDSGFRDGRLIARFEPRVFLRMLSTENRKIGEMFFTVGVSVRDEKMALSGWWKSFHGDNVLEWLAIGVASVVDRDAALQSSSFGIAQIMGFNAQMVGYANAQAMVDAFQKSEESQAKAFFDYCVAKKDSHGSALQALRDGDLWRFAHLYNGEGQEEYYSERIRKTLE